MGKAKKCIIAICIAVLLVGVGAGTIIYRQAQGNESLWGTFAKDHKDLVKKYSDWFNKDGEFYFKIAEGKRILHGGIRYLIKWQTRKKVRKYRKN